MEAIIRKSTSEKVKDALVRQGRKKNWLAEQLKISRPTLNERLESNSWLVGEITILTQLRILTPKG